MRRTTETAAAKDPWVELGLSPALLDAVRRAKFDAPTDIQREMIPHALRGEDCLGQAQTGTGKTAGFAIPMLQRLVPGQGLQAIILAPTRELAAQVDEHVRQLSKGMPVQTVVILGGRRIKDQIAVLRRNPEIAIGTPGRVLDLMRRKELNIGQVKLAVLDEVDRMLDIGFRDDIRRILRGIEVEHQTIFVSATIDDEIQKLARSFMHTPVEINVSHDMMTVEGVHQGFVSVLPEDKISTLLGFLKHEAPTLAIVFTNTKHKARRVAQHLKRAGVDCKEIHGDLDQERRERVMKSFRKLAVPVLVATDLASRGLDVMDISHIVNFDVPEDPTAYVHRIGRTARMGRSGCALTFITPEEGKYLTGIEKLINKEIPQFDPPWLIKRLPPVEKVAAAAADQAAPEETGPVAPKRLCETASRDEILEAHGVRPVRRTLGSRFRSARKYRR